MERRTPSCSCNDSTSDCEKRNIAEQLADTWQDFNEWLNKPYRKTGRYITADPIGLKGGINLFVYVENNPVRYIDPKGLDRYTWCTYRDHKAPGCKKVTDYVCGIFCGFCCEFERASCNNNPREGETLEQTLARCALEYTQCIGSGGPGGVK